MWSFYSRLPAIYPRSLQGFSRSLLRLRVDAKATRGSIAASISQKGLPGVSRCQNSRHKMHSSPHCLQCISDVQLRGGFVVLLHSDDPGTPISDRYRKTPCKDCFVGGLKWACSYAVYICGVRFKEGFVEYLFLLSFFSSSFSCGVFFAKMLCGVFYCGELFCCCWLLLLLFSILCGGFLWSALCGWFLLRTLRWTLFCGACFGVAHEYLLRRAFVWSTFCGGLFVEYILRFLCVEYLLQLALWVDFCRSDFCVQTFAEEFLWCTLCCGDCVVYHLLWWFCGVPFVDVFLWPTLFVEYPFAEMYILKYLLWRSSLHPSHTTLPIYTHMKRAYCGVPMWAGFLWYTHASAIVLTLGNKVILYCIVLYCMRVYRGVLPPRKAIRNAPLWRTKLLLCRLWCTSIYDVALFLHSFSVI